MKKIKQHQDQGEKVVDSSQSSDTKELNNEVRVLKKMLKSRDERLKSANEGKVKKQRRCHFEEGVELKEIVMKVLLDVKRCKVLKCTNAEL